MSIENGIFHRDIARIAAERQHETALIGRPIVDPVALDEANFLLDHGMTRAQAGEAQRVRARQDYEAGAVADLTYSEPPKEICDTRGLSPKRARYARYFELRFQEAKKLSDLESKKAHLELLIDAPKTTESEIRKEIGRTAASLLGRNMGGVDGSKRRTLEDRLTSERHAADAARQAMPEVERQIDVARLRLSTLNSRESEFINPAIMEVADELGLGDLYLKKVRELRSVLSLMNGLLKVAGEWGEFTGLQGKLRSGDQFVSAEAVRLPCPRLSSMSAAERDDLVLSGGGGNDDAWRQIKQSLLLDPKHNARNCIALPCR